MANPNAASGVYLIKPEKATKPFKAFCEKREDGGWTVFQRRNGKGEDGKPVTFRKFWDDYKRGFGHTAHEHWLGLDRIYALSQQTGKVCQLRVDMMNCKEETGYALYGTFKIDNEREFYQLHLGNFTGNAGDAFRGEEESGDQTGCSFSTYDKDNDGCEICVRGGQAFSSCARDLYGSGWWFSNCGMANLNGDWHPKEECEGWLAGVYWETWDYVNSLLFSEIKVKCTAL
uniref:Fibrinogen C-terminal domain-containing protein n=1 Tax=Sphenodon punctatus TaxID=8508 RepID=A0A8D0G7N3_SPHPU